jgi:hypothetical protein
MVCLTGLKAHFGRSFESWTYLGKNSPLLADTREFSDSALSDVLGPAYPHPYNAA